jgi:cytochrome P450
VKTGAGRPGTIGTDWLDIQSQVISPGKVRDTSFAEFRRGAPVRLVCPFRSFPSLPAYVLYRRVDVLRALGDSDVFSLAPVMARYEAVLGSATLTEPAWRVLRDRVSPILSPPSLTRISETALRPLAQRLISQLPAGDPVELMDGLARPLPAQMLCYLIGIDPAEWRMVYAAVRDMASFGRQPLAGLRGARTLRAQVGELTGCAAPRSPGPVLEALRETALAPSQMADVLMLVCWAAVETTGPALGTVLRSVLGARRHGPHDARAAQAQRAALAALTADAPVQMTCRLTRTDVHLSGVDIPEGALVLPHLGSAALDGEGGRHRRTPLIFGFGSHRCIGAALALAEITIAVEELLHRYPRTRLIGRPADVHGEFIRGPETIWAQLE